MNILKFNKICYHIHVSYIELQWTFWIHEWTKQNQQIMMLKKYWWNQSTHLERFTCFISSLTNSFIHVSKNTSCTQSRKYLPRFIWHHSPSLNLWLGEFLGLKLLFFNDNFGLGEFKMGRNSFQWRRVKITRSENNLVYSMWPIWP